MTRGRRKIGSSWEVKDSRFTPVRYSCSYRVVLVWMDGVCARGFDRNVVLESL